jgi:hypothetical protein
MEIIKVSTDLAWDQRGQFGVAFSEFSQYGVRYQVESVQVSGVRCQDSEPEEVDIYQIPHFFICFLTPET